MRKTYFRFRIFLIMFALGLASVTFFNGYGKQTDEIPINLPQVVSNFPIYIYPKKSKVFTHTQCSGHSCFTEEFIELVE